MLYYTAGLTLVRRGSCAPSQAAVGVVIRLYYIYIYIYKTILYIYVQDTAIFT